MQAHVPACLLLPACRQRLSGLQQLFGLSDSDVVALFRCLVELLWLKPEEVVRPRRDKLEALLGRWVVVCLGLCVGWLGGRVACWYCSAVRMACRNHSFSPHAHTFVAEALAAAFFVAPAAGPFDKQMLRRFIHSRFVFRLPVATMEAVFEGAAELMGGEEAAQQLLRAEPKLFAAGVQRLRLNLAALQHPVAGCTLEEARQVLLSTPQLAVLALDTPKFRRRMEALTDFYEHANTGAVPASSQAFRETRQLHVTLLVPGLLVPIAQSQKRHTTRACLPSAHSPAEPAAEMLLSRNRGTHLMSSLWTVGPRMAFVRHLRLKRGQPGLRTSAVACTLGPFCRAVRADVATYKGFEAGWLASPEAAQLCEHEPPRRQATPTGSGGGDCSSSSSSSDDDGSSSSSEEDERG